MRGTAAYRLVQCRFAAFCTLNIRSPLSAAQDCSPVKGEVSYVHGDTAKRQSEAEHLTRTLH